MKLLLKAAIYQKKYIPLVIASLLALMSLTLASSLEMFAVGILSGKGEALLRSSETEGKTTFFYSLQQQVYHFKESMHHKYSQGADSSEWIFLIGVLVFIIAFKALTLFYSRFFTQVLSVKISKDLRERYFQHLQKLPMKFYEKYFKTITNSSG